MSRPICGGNGYTLGGLTGETISLPLSLGTLPQEITLEGHHLLLRESFHVSLVCIRQIIEKQSVEEQNFVTCVITDFCDFTEGNPVRFSGFRDDFKFVEENEKRTVVVMCDVTNLDRFFDHLNQKYELSLEYPPTHVTIYTLQPNKGIFLVDSEDIKELTKSIPNPLDSLPSLELWL